MRDACDYAAIGPAHRGLPATHNVRGYHICEDCYQAMRAAERASDAAYDAVNRAQTQPAPTAEAEPNWRIHLIGCAECSAGDFCDDDETKCARCGEVRGSLIHSDSDGTLLVGGREYALHPFKPVVPPLSGEHRHCWHQWGPSSGSINGDGSGHQRGANRCCHCGEIERYDFQTGASKPTPHGPILRRNHEVSRVTPSALYRREKRKAATRKRKRGPSEMERANAKWAKFIADGGLWGADPRRMRPSARRKVKT